MQIIIDKNEFNLTPSIVKSLTPSFTLLNGRRFCLQAKSGKVFKNISLNSLILAIKNEVFKSKRDKNEIRDFFKAFKAIKDKGYEIPDGQINKENFIIRVITKLKHFFSRSVRAKFLKELKVKINASENKNSPQVIITPETKKKYQKIIPSLGLNEGINSLPDDIIQYIFLQLDDVKDIEAASLVNKKFYANANKEILWKTKCVKDFPKYHDFDPRVPYDFSDFLAPFASWKEHYCDLKNGGPVYGAAEPGKKPKRLKIIIKPWF